EIVAEEALDVLEDVRRRGVVQAMAPVVEPLARPLEAPRVPAHDPSALDSRDARPPKAAQLIRRAAPRRAAAEDHDVRLLALHDRHHRVAVASRSRDALT